MIKLFVFLVRGGGHLRVDFGSRKISSTMDTRNICDIGPTIAATRPTPIVLASRFIRGNTVPMVLRQN